ncbi:hypothetical protein EON63_20065, partial [archaeon]
MNSGSLLCRASRYTITFLQQWYSTPTHRKYFSDQEAFDLLYTQHNTHIHRHHTHHVNPHTAPHTQHTD